jgi:hypothetical protein
MKIYFIILCLCFSLSLLFDIISISFINESTNKASYTISLVFISLSIIFYVALILSWLFDRCMSQEDIHQHTFKIINIINIFIKTVNTFTLSLFSFYFNYINKTITIYVYINFILSFIIPFLIKKHFFTIFTRIQPVNNTHEVIELESPRSRTGPSFNVIMISSVLSYNENEETNTCSICLIDFLKGDQCTLTVCHHYFHVSCFYELIKNNIQLCPICRTKL